MIEQYIQTISTALTYYESIAAFRGMDDDLKKAKAAIAALERIRRQLAEDRTKSERTWEALKTIWPFVEEEDLGEYNSAPFTAALAQGRAALSEGKEGS
jgi:hypothetical protein